MKTLPLSILLITALALGACDKQITLQLDSPPSRLVIEGGIERVKDNPDGRQIIVLSTLNDFFEPDQTPRVTDASVSVSNERGQSWSFVHNNAVPGQYEAENLIGEVGEAYTLTIDWNGDRYSATTEMTGVAPIERVYQFFEESNAFEDGGLKVAIDFTDPAGNENFYFWQLFQDGQNLITPDPGNSGNIIAKDEFWDGQTIEGYLPSEERVFEPGDEVLVRHIGISQEYFDFLFLLFEQTGQTGQLIDVPPALIRGNAGNLTNPDNFPVGYFWASEVDEKTIVIE